MKMDLKTKIKNFFTLTPKTNGGFTLVELIVVIAILGILGGVAVPAYSGYVKKANNAADQQLLADLNTAFAAACATNGEDYYNRSNTDISLTDVEGGKSVSALIVDNAKVADSFINTYYEGGVFKVYTYLAYDGTLGMFVEGFGKLAQIIQSSSFAGNLEGITGDVDDLVGMLSAFLATPEGQEMLLGSGFADYLEEMGIDASDPSATEVSNAAVLYLAKLSAQMSDDNIQAATGTMEEVLFNHMYGGGIGTGAIEELAKSTGDSTLAAYATYYATAEAIALAQGKGTAAYEALTASTPSNETEVLQTVDAVLKATPNEWLDAYIGEGDSSQLAKDLDAYFQTLTALNSKESELKGSLGEEDLFQKNELIQDMIGQLQG